MIVLPISSPLNIPVEDESIRIFTDFLHRRSRPSCFKLFDLKGNAVLICLSIYF